MFTGKRAFDPWPDVRWKLAEAYLLADPCGRRGGGLLGPGGVLARDPRSDFGAFSPSRGAKGRVS